MEQTPFDPPPTPPAPAFQAPPQGYATPSGYGATPGPRKKRFLWPAIALLALCLAAAGAGGTIYWQRQAEERAREAKLAALRQDIKSIVLQDNALVLEMLDAGALEHITFAEFFKRADKNKEERDDLIRKLRATETGPYGEAVGNFIKLMEQENEWVRSEEAVSRANLDISGKWDAFKEASEQSDSAATAVSSARRSYMAAPYESDYAEKATLEFAHSRFESANESVKASLTQWKKSSDDLKEKKDSAAVTISDWMRQEPLWYPNFAPPRHVLDLLVKKKRDYTGEESSRQDAPQKAAAPKSQAAVTGVAARSEPTSTPAPRFPTRTHSLEALPGERFPETRMRDLTPEEVAEMSDEDLRYAINEMFARYGMTFKDKDYQTNFEGQKWYQPDEQWKPAQIKRAFTAREKANLDLLSAERGTRRSSGSIG